MSTRPKKDGVSDSMLISKVAFNWRGVSMDDGGWRIGEEGGVKNLLLMTVILFYG